MSQKAKARYIEVSPRQTGKSHRLIQDATHQRYGHDKIIVIVSPLDAYYWKQDAPFVKVVAKTEAQAERELAKLGIDPESEKIAWYYDEFDFIKGLEQIRDGGYYTTTPKTLRDYANATPGQLEEDFLLRLVVQNGCVYVTALPNPSNPERRTAHVHNLPPEAVDTEALGRLWTVSQEAQKPYRP